MQLTQHCFLHLCLPPSPRLVSFLDYMLGHCQRLLRRNQVLCYSKHQIKLHITVKGKPHARFAVALGGLVTIFAGSAFFLSRACEYAVRLPL